MNQPCCLQTRADKGVPLLPARPPVAMCTSVSAKTFTETDFRDPQSRYTWGTASSYNCPAPGPWHPDLHRASPPAHPVLWGSRSTPEHQNGIRSPHENSLKWQVAPPQVDWLLEGSQVSPAKMKCLSGRQPEHPPVSLYKGSPDCSSSAFRGGTCSCVEQSLASADATAHQELAATPRRYSWLFLKIQAILGPRQPHLCSQPPPLASNCACAFASCQDTLPIRPMVAY